MYLQDEGVKHRDCLMASVSSGTEMATGIVAIISAVACRQRRGENSRKERAGWVRQMGIRGSEGTTPTEPLRYNSAKETLER